MSLHQQFCQTGSPNEITELLAGVKSRLNLMGVPDPLMVTVDNCCHVRNFILGVFANIKVLLDVHHFIMRCVVYDTVCVVRSASLHE
ncbi:hypothetical protein B0H16DRAFT_1344253 [Mycena metata]|uniref:Uncharacterized protein n=1 Tax=Mycena metata TaxID=1033252 RepID=A0AAD7MC14_9AGAR|nr:hypothetical protein B0H16DRAFT_1344253 [Mycena metata]